VNHARTPESSRPLSRDEQIARTVQEHADVCVDGLCRALATRLSIALPAQARSVLVDRLCRAIRQVLDDELAPYRSTGLDSHIDWLHRQRWPVTKATYVLAMHRGDAIFAFDPDVVAAIPEHVPGPLPRSRKEWVAQLHKDLCW
jgi:hypothetical protein